MEAVKIAAGFALAIACACSSLCTAGNIICEIPDDKELQALEDAGDIRASYLLGARNMNPNGRDRSWEKAQIHFAKAADKHHPPSMYFLALAGGGGSSSERFALTLNTAERGFKRAYADLAYIYSNEEGDMYSKVDAYAWITICAEHDWFCRGDDLKKFLSSLSDRDKALGEQLKARIIEKQKSYPAFEEVSDCINEWKPAPR